MSNFYAAAPIEMLHSFSVFAEISRSLPLSLAKGSHENITDTLIFC